MATDIEHWRINAKIYRDRIEETHYLSDPIRNIRRKPEVRIWNVEGFIGRGGWGEVRLERSRENGSVRAVKRIVLRNTDCEDLEYEKELSALLQFSKPKYKEAACFTEFLGWFRDKSEVFLVMEYIQLGDLEKNVVKCSGRLPSDEVRSITQQILTGLAIMHVESFAHRDLKPQNVLVVHGPPNWWIKLADFGLSKRLTDLSAYDSKAGTELYMSPEQQGLVVEGAVKGKYTNAVDIWAAGCISYRLIAGVVPFPRGAALEKFCKDKSLFPLKALFDCGAQHDTFEFLRDILVTNPDKRPTAVGALQHRWMRRGNGISTAAQLDGTALPVTLIRNDEILESSSISDEDESHLSKLTIETASNAYLHSSRTFSTSITASSARPEIGEAASNDSEKLVHAQSVLSKARRTRPTTPDQSEVVQARHAPRHEVDEASTAQPNSEALSRLSKTAGIASAIKTAFSKMELFMTREPPIPYTPKLDRSNGVEVASPTINSIVGGNTLYYSGYFDIKIVELQSIWETYAYSNLSDRYDFHLNFEIGASRSTSLNSKIRKGHRTYPHVLSFFDNINSEGLLIKCIVFAANPGVKSGAVQFEGGQCLSDIDDILSRSFQSLTFELFLSNPALRSSGKMNKRPPVATVTTEIRFIPDPDSETFAARRAAHEKEAMSHKTGH